MNKSVTTKRTWQIAPFHMLEVAQATTEVPESLANDSYALDLVYREQLMEVELQFQNYLNVLKKMEEFGKDIDAKVKYLEEERKKYNQKYIEYLAKEK